jgi:hypothetical protein
VKEGSKEGAKEGTKEVMLEIFRKFMKTSAAKNILKTLVAKSSDPELSAGVISGSKKTFSEDDMDSFKSITNSLY